MKLLLFVLSLLCIPLNAQPLWGGTVKGMTPEEVLSRVDGARAIKYGGDTAAEGRKELVRLDDLRIENEPFQVRFYFKGNSLSLVSLVLSTRVTETMGVRIFEKLSNALRAKYGDEHSRSVDSRFASATWLGKDNLRVSLIYVISMTDQVCITYQNESLERNDKL